jgi:ribose transport system permease protein
MRQGMSGWAAIPAGIGAGAACGAVSGLLVARARVQPFVATLAMMAFARGLAKWLAGGKVVTAYPYPGLVEALNGKVGVLGARVSINVFVFLACAGATLVLLRALALGTRVYAVGDNEEGARRAGVQVGAVKWLAYTYCGALAGLAGVLFAALVRQGNPDEGVGYELTAIAMVVIGGTALSGGRGGMVLTLLGVLTVGYLRKILDINNVETPMQLMITGGIIVMAVLVQGVRR